MAFFQLLYFILSFKFAICFPTAIKLNLAILNDVTQFSPNITALTVTPNGDIWASGDQNSTANYGLLLNSMKLVDNTKTEHIVRAGSDNLGLLSEISGARFLNTSVLFLAGKFFLFFLSRY